MRPTKWNDPGMICFRSEQYLIDALKEDMLMDGFLEMTNYFNVIILKILGEDNDAYKKFISEHEEYASRAKI